MAALLLGPLGFAAGIGAVSAVRSLAPGSSGHFERQGGYRLVEPLLDYEVAQQMELKTPLLKHRVSALVEEAIRRHHTSHVSVYFRDLHNGPWFGIHEREPFTPASLLKVPILMAYLKQAEADPGLLARQLTYVDDPRIPSPNIRSAEAIEAGRPYPVAELLERMIAYSDNRATAALGGGLDKAVLNQTFASLGVPVPDDRQPDEPLTVKAYATFFRVLFNATYLSPAMSERALELLTRSEFKAGLVAGVPPGVVVAHKFGERSVASERTRQLHDCGVVYCPRAPYLLCVMSRGEDFQQLAGTIRDISRLVYGEVCR